MRSMIASLSEDAKPLTNNHSMELFLFKFAAREKTLCICHPFLTIEPKTFASNLSPPLK